MTQSNTQYNRTQTQLNTGSYADSYEVSFRSHLSAWEDNIVGAYLTTVCVLAVALNSMVIYTCIKHWNSLVMSDYYILNLACSDVILPLSSFPLAISSSFRHVWIYGHIGCTAYGLLGFFFGLVSITTLTIMGVIRYISICHPHIDVSTVQFTRSIIASCYAYSFIWAVTPLSGWGSYTVEAYGTSCTLQWDQNRSFITLMSMFCIITPSIIMMFTYGLIVLKCRQSNRNLNRNRPGNSVKVSKKESFLIKITFAMCWGFLISWMPYAVVSMWTAYGDPSFLPTRLTVLAVLLAKTSTVVNPVIYFLMSKKFRPMLTESFNLERITKLRLLRNNSSSVRSKSTLLKADNVRISGNESSTDNAVLKTFIRVAISDANLQNQDVVHL